MRSARSCAACLRAEPRRSPVWARRLEAPPVAMPPRQPPWCHPGRILGHSEDRCHARPPDGGPSVTVIIPQAPAGCRLRLRLAALGNRLARRLFLATGGGLMVMEVGGGTARLSDSVKTKAITRPTGTSSPGWALIAESIPEDGSSGFQPRSCRFQSPSAVRPSERVPPPLSASEPFCLILRHLQCRHNDFPRHHTRARRPSSSRAVSTTFVDVGMVGSSRTGQMATARPWLRFLDGASR